MSPLSRWNVFISRCICESCHVPYSVQCIRTVQFRPLYWPRKVSYSNPINTKNFIYYCLVWVLLRVGVREILCEVYIILATFFPNMLETCCDMIQLEKHKNCINKNVIANLGLSMCKMCHKYSRNFALKKTWKMINLFSTGSNPFPTHATVVAGSKCWSPC